MPTLQLPASWLRHGRPLPSRCARHGLPATESHRVRLARRPRGWIARAAGPVLAALVTFPSHVATTPEWPFCRDCRQERELRLAAGVALMGAALLPAAALFITAPLTEFAGSGAATMLTTMLCAVLLGVGLALAAAASWPMLSGAVLSRDGAWLLVDAAPPFANEVLQSPRTGQRAATSVRLNSTLD